MKTAKLHELVEMADQGKVFVARIEDGQSGKYEWSESHNFKSTSDIQYDASDVVATWEYLD